MEAVTHEREISRAVELCGSDGRLNPDAVGWSRTPLHTTNLSGWGRRKRWEYWAVQTPDHVLALTVSNIDYLALHSVWFADFGAVEVDKTAIVPLARGPEFPPYSGGDVAVHAGGVDISITQTDGGVRLRARTERVDADILVTRPPQHESLGVVIPWASDRFQYTVKDNTLPATGYAVVDGKRYEFGADAWAVLDHGRGKWPYSIRWNWGSGSGTTDGRTIGIQVGGKWTDGTGMTENALCIDGRLHKIGDDLRWEYDTDDWLAPWRITAPSGRLDLTFTPKFERKSRTQAVLISVEVHQCFGEWSGTVVDDAGLEIPVSGVHGFAEEARNRW